MREIGGGAWAEERKAVSDPAGTKPLSAKRKCLICESGGGI